MSVLLSLICVVVVCFLYYFHHSFSYWKRKGIPYIQPSIPLGSITLSYAKRASQSTEKMYNKFKSAGVKYGGFYMSTMPVFMPIDPELIKEVMTKSFDHFHERGIYYDEELDPLSAHLFALGGTKWKYLRSKLSPTFTSGKIKMMYPTLVACSENIETFLQTAHLDSKAVDIKELSATFATDVIASCAFGIECNSIINPDTEFRKYGRLFLDNNMIDKIRMVFGIMFPSVLRLFKIPFIKPLVSKYFISVIKQAMTYREKHQLNRKDFLDLLIRIKNNENIDDDDFLMENQGSQVKGTAEGITPAQIAAQAFVFYVAGFETSSSTMTFCLFELAQHQDIQDKVREEILNVLQKYNGQITYEGIMEMTYLEMVINETLRKYPSIFMLNRICTKDYKIEGTDTIIEKGTRVILPVIGLHKDPEYYPNPEIFDPNRFSQDEIEKRIPYTYMPFGEGPRFCIGMRFGMLQTKIGIISMVKNYRHLLHSSTKLPIDLISNILILTTNDKIYLKLEKL